MQDDAAHCFPSSSSSSLGCELKNDDDFRSHGIKNGDYSVFFRLPRSLAFDACTAIAFRVLPFARFEAVQRDIQSKHLDGDD